MPICLLCSLALSSLNKLSEAVFYYRKALELDPDNETYKSNLKVTEQKMKEAPSPVSSWLGGWWALRGQGPPLCPQGTWQGAGLMSLPTFPHRRAAPAGSTWPGC